MRRIPAVTPLSRLMPALLLLVLACVSPPLAVGADGCEHERPPRTEPVTSGADREVFYYFFSYSCAYCRDATRYVRELARRYSGVEFHELEIVMDRDNQALLAELAARIGIEVPGVPLFVYGGRYVVGFKDQERQRARIEAMLEGEQDSPFTTVAGIDLADYSMPLFTVVVGALDGVNPCSLYVLIFLMTLLVSASDRRRMLALGGGFVAVTALVYFVFLAFWLHIFSLLSVRMSVTMILGAIICVLGMFHLKDLFWFRRGPTLSIPERAKPALFRRMRRIVENPRLSIALAGIALLAFVVSFLEFGCTVGLPAVYTRVLTLQNISPTARYLYIFLYSVVYTVPLLALVVAFTFTLGRVRYTEKMGRILKGVSGALMVGLGIVLVVDYRLLVF